MSFFITWKHNERTDGCAFSFEAESSNRACRRLCPRNYFENPLSRAVNVGTNDNRSNNRCLVCEGADRACLMGKWMFTWLHFQKKILDIRRLTWTLKHCKPLSKKQWNQTGILMFQHSMLTEWTKRNCIILKEVSWYNHYNDECVRTFGSWYISYISCLSWLLVNRGLDLMEHVSGLKTQRLQRAGASKITTLCRVCESVTGVVHELAWK